MTSTIDYFFAPHSPWTYLGHARLVAMAEAAGATVRLKPMDLNQVFPVSGGLPLAKRAPQRQAYRLVELARFARHLQLPLNLQPRFFPVDGNAAARLILAVEAAHGTPQALAFAGRAMAAVWAQERDIADAAVLGGLLTEQGLPTTSLIDAAQGPEVQQRYEAFTQEAIASHVFGAPTYVVDGEMFWGQDRLDFVERALSR
ncbi:2-hydroxychromene-2-carboxylate isomerase [Xenophilus arseniciresistens]|uniref:2-hydroxychromene-2-carboxylate isomerase n=1 Tax=Xenophilus arseniciresistens TaxID=1283306 RepID=A0AAE3T1R7_9BURK|nr:2-hydroxychromene-2-carboxylate isomerase [Xenophilus arseniciresistens]MDA7418236.1 2-hydroxychromene-2-carboxylate isomerase [Xenophilus arseniciresistens]